jgi:hypothetical protein
MPKSSKQILDQVFAGLETRNKALYEEVTNLPAAEQLIILSAANFVLNVQDNLTRANKVDTGGLFDDIAQGELIKTASGYEISVGYPKGSKAAKYYDFVNKGVRGTASEIKAPNSPYKFEYEYPKWGGEFHLAILKWYRRHASFGRKETQKDKLSGLQKKRKKLLKMVDAEKNKKSLAYATAINIKRKGLKTTGFFDKAYQQSFGKDFVNQLGKAIGRDIQLLVSYGNNNQ